MNDKTQISLSKTQLIYAISIVVLLSASCHKEPIKTPDPIPKWENTFTPYLENNNQRDTVYDDENITISTNNTPSDRYIWSWGDGSKSDTTQTIYAVHQFKKLGLNIIKLRVERGYTYGEKSDSVWVKHHYVPFCQFRIDSDDSLYVEHESHFVANISSVNCQSTCGFTYLWDFGDGEKGNGYHTKHSYAKTGSYLVSALISRCSGPDTIIQKQIVVSGSNQILRYKCLCVPSSGVNPFSDNIEVQNLPYNPIKVNGQVLRRSGKGNRYIGDFNCNPNRCDTYLLDVFDNLDSIQMKVNIPYVEYTCRGRRF